MTIDSPPAAEACPTQSTPGGYPGNGGGGRSVPLDNESQHTRSGTLLEEKSGEKGRHFVREGSAKGAGEARNSNADSFEIPPLLLYVLLSVLGVWIGIWIGVSKAFV